jgi:hypothetical protein
MSVERSRIDLISQPQAAAEEAALECEPNHAA